MSQALVAKRDTYIYLMDNMDHETFIPEGTWMFHVTNKNYTKYLESDEVCIYSIKDGINFSYVGDWEEYALP